MSKIGLFIGVLIIIFVPLYPKFPLLGIGGSIVSVRIEDFIVAFGFLAYLLFQFKNRFKDFKNPVVRAIVIYLLASAVALFSAAFLTKSVELKIGLLHWARRIEYMSMFLVGMWSIQKKIDVDFIIKTILIVSFLVSIYGLGQQFLNFPVISTTNSEFAKGLAVTLGPGARINSTFAGHYDLAAFFLFPLLLCLGLLNLKISLKNRILVGIVGGLSYWTMLLSASRITFAAIFLTAGLFVLVIRKYRWIPWLVVLAVVSIFISPQLVARYKDLITNYVKISYVTPVMAALPADEQQADALKPPEVAEDRSLSIRINAEWPTALRAFAKNPLLGTGFSSVGLAVDNDFLRLLAETGFFGFFAFLLIMIRIFKTSLPFLISPPQDPASTLIVTTTMTLVGILATAVFIDVFEASKIAIMLWLLLGMTEKLKIIHD